MIRASVGRLAIVMCCATAGLGSLACTSAPPESETPPPAEYVGTVGRELVSAGFGVTAELEPADEEIVDLLGDLVPEGATVQTTAVQWKNDTRLQVHYIESPDGTLYAAADVDGNGRIEPGERSVFEPVDDTFMEEGAFFQLPLQEGHFAHYALGIFSADFSQYEDAEAETDGPDVLYMGGPFVEGVVDIDGHPVKVRVGYDLDESAVMHDSGLQYLDANHDGSFDTSFTSREMVYLSGDEAPPIYRVDGRYVSIDSVDLESRRVVLKTHPPDAYRRIELATGIVLPDFDFVDLDGAARNTAEFRGKYLLVDAWGTWCAPCRAEMPHLKEAYAAYRDKGFEIVGLDQEWSDPDNYETGLEKLRDFVARYELEWVQATEESVGDLIRHRLIVNVYPTTILLDPDGTIISLNRPGDPGVYGGRLKGTLERLLGPAS